MLHLLSELLPSLGLLLLVLGAATGYGGLALAPLGLPGLGRGERLLFALGLGLGALSLLLLLVAALGLLSAPMLWALQAPGLAALVLGRRLWPPVVPATPPAKGFSWPQVALTGVLFLTIALPLIYGLVAHALVPPVDYDVVAYHFAIPRLYLKAGGLVYLPFILHSNWPLGAEMLFMLGLGLGSEAAAQLITLAFAALLCAAIVAFGEGWLLARSGWLAAAAFAAVPMVGALAGTGMVELPLTCYTFLAFFALWRWRERGAWGWLVLSALLAGCAAAVKLNGAAAAIIFACVAAGAHLRERQPLAAARSFALYGLVSLLVVLPWYLKAWVFTGNPIWPFLHGALGGRNWDALGGTYLNDYLRATNMAPTLGNWLTGLWQVTRATGRFGSFELGPYMLALLPLGLLPAILRPALRPLLLTLLLLTLAFYTAWFLMTHQTRFLLPAVPFALLFGAAGVVWLWERAPRPLSAALQLGLVAWLFAGAWVFDADRRAAWQRSQPFLLGQIDRDAFLTAVYPDYPAFAFLNRQLAPTDRVLLAPYEARGYYLDGAYIWANPIGQRYLRLDQIADAAALREELRRLGVTHVLLNSRFVLDSIPHWEHIDALLNELVARDGELIYESGQSRVYLLGPEPTVAAGVART